MHPLASLKAVNIEGGYKASPESSKQANRVGGFREPASRVPGPCPGLSRSELGANAQLAH